jgi:hypothetical protein
MWDGRQTAPCETLATDLGNQAADAVKGHMQATTPLSDENRKLIVDREHIIFFAQSSDFQAGPLDEDGALGGPINLAGQTFYFGMNAYPGPDPDGVAYNSKVFTLFDAWAGLGGSDPQTAARLAIVRGQALFNTRTFTISGVSGLNDELGQTSIPGTCSTCHNAPNLGNNSEGRFFNTGVSDASARTPDMPLYTLKNSATGETIQTMDPGRALISGAWRDVGRFKVPSLRGLAGRGQYFHDGSAVTLVDVVNRDDARFGIGLTDAEKSDLVAFLNAL